MKHKTFLAFFIVLLSGCVFYSGPEGNTRFYQISRLSELEGVYKNKGNPSGFLSQKIWPDITKIFPDIKEVMTFDTGHEDIEFIEVITKDNSLVLKAIQNGCSVYEKTYILGRDFEISNGKVVIHREAHLLSRGSGDVLAGPSYEDITMGIDTGKQGKSRSTSYAAGLIFMVMPVAISETTDIRYERVSNNPQNFKACISR